MAAYVTERAKRTLFVANNDDRFASQLGGEKRFGIGYGVICSVHFATGLIEGADHLPDFVEDLGFFDFEDGGIGVEARGERVGAFDLFVDVEAEGMCGHGCMIER